MPFRAPQWDWIDQRRCQTEGAYPQPPSLSTSRSWRAFAPRPGSANLAAVNPALLRLLVSNGGMVAREAALAHVEHDVLDRAVRSGRLLCPYPRVYLDPELGDDRMALTRAAVLYAGGRAAVSHLSALGLWRLPLPDDGPVHLMTAPSSHLRGAPGLIVHRRAALGRAPPEVLVRGELPVIRLERSIVDSWPLLSGDAKRAPVIFAVGGRMTTVGRVRDALGAAPRLGGPPLPRAPARPARARVPQRAGAVGVRECLPRSGPALAGAVSARATDGAPRRLRRGGPGQLRTRRPEVPRQRAGSRARPATRRRSGGLRDHGRAL